MGAAAVGALVGGGLGIMKSKQEQEKEELRNKLAAQESAINPLFSIATGQAYRPGEVTNNARSQFDGLLQGGMSGAQFGMDNAGAAEAAPGAQKVGGGQAIQGQSLTQNTRQPNLYRTA